MFGEHAAFIIPSYVVSALALVISIVWIRSAYSRRMAELAKLESEGATRRSKESAPNG